MPSVDDSTPAATTEASSMLPGRITGNKISLTDSLREYRDATLTEVVRRIKSLLNKVNVHLTVEHISSIELSKNAEVVAFAVKTTLRNKAHEADLYVTLAES